MSRNCTFLSNQIHNKTNGETVTPRSQFGRSWCKQVQLRTREIVGMRLDFFSSVITCVALAPPSASLCLHRLLPWSFFGRALAGLYEIVHACVSHYTGRFEILDQAPEQIREKWGGGVTPVSVTFFAKNRTNIFCSLFLKHFFFKNIFRRTVFETFP